jgi:3-methylcrotonyl-CoA carboxylase beta subunit
MTRVSPAPFPVLSSTADPSTPDFQRNAARHRELVADLRARLERAALGGPESARRRHVERGKLLPRERLAQLLDLGSPFLELSPLAATG